MSGGKKIGIKWVNAQKLWTMRKGHVWGSMYMRVSNRIQTETVERDSMRVCVRALAFASINRSL